MLWNMQSNLFYTPIFWLVNDVLWATLAHHMPLKYRWAIEMLNHIRHVYLNKWACYQRTYPTCHISYPVHGSWFTDNAKLLRQSTWWEANVNWSHHGSHFQRLWLSFGKTPLGRTEKETSEGLTPSLLTRVRMARTCDPWLALSLPPPLWLTCRLKNICLPLGGVYRPLGCWLQSQGWVMALGPLSPPPS